MNIGKREGNIDREKLLKAAENRRDKQDSTSYPSTSTKGGDCDRTSGTQPYEMEELSQNTNSDHV